MQNDKITLEEGAGGREMINLLKDTIFPEIFSESFEIEIGLEDLDDGASIKIEDKHLVFTTDSHVVKPLFFPGGDIGRLAVSGTVNDLSAMGAKPLGLSSGIVVENGFEKEELKKISSSMGETSREAEVPIITGDTKVVGEGETDGIVINTSGVGIAESLTPASGLKPGDELIISGEIGNHGMSIVTSREGFDFEIESDVAPVNKLVEKIIDISGLHSLKDPTRGGLAAALNEMAVASDVGMRIDKKKIPVSSEVKGAGELLGIDPLKIANEGRIIVGADSSSSSEILEKMKETEMGKNSKVIGRCVEENKGKVLLKTEIGSSRILKTPRRKPIPRIC